MALRALRPSIRMGTLCQDQLREREGGRKREGSQRGERIDYRPDIIRCESKHTHTHTVKMSQTPWCGKGGGVKNSLIRPSNMNGHVGATETDVETVRVWKGFKMRR